MTRCGLRVVSRTVFSFMAIALRRAVGGARARCGFGLRLAVAVCQ